MLIGAVVLAIAGGIVGLVLGVTAYPPTAWFAVIEVGLPATIVGGLLGLAAGLAGRATSQPSNHEPECSRGDRTGPA